MTPSVGCAAVGDSKTPRRDVDHFANIGLRESADEPLSAHFCPLGAAVQRALMPTWTGQTSAQNGSCEFASFSYRHSIQQEEDAVSVEVIGSTVNADLIIVGAGPVGLFGAYYAGCRGLSTVVVDALEEVGGQVSAMYPEKEIFDIAGFPAVKGRELVARLSEQAAAFEPHYLLGQRAELLKTRAEAGAASAVEVTTSAGITVRAGGLIVTAGVGAFTPRPLGVGEEFEGRGLAYFVPDPTDYAGDDVVIVGGGDSAFDWAKTLTPLAKSVTLVHRRNRFRAHESTVAQVCASSVEVLTETEVVSVKGDQSVEAVVLAGAGVAQEGILRPCQRLVAALGFVANLGPLRDWGLDLAARRHIIVDSAMRTSVPGVFAAGDITEYPGKVRLIAVGFGEVATAVNNAAVFMDPEAELFPGHSTDGLSSARTDEVAAVR